MLGLASVSVRSSSVTAARAEARANARLALSIAIGELQKNLGPDQRITARASAIESGATDKNLVGVWESWRWDPEGGSAEPDYSEKSGQFRRWLASTAEPGEAADPAVPSFSDPVWLIEPETGGSSDTGLRASKVGVEGMTNQGGALAYAVMDESMKAPIQLPETENPTTADALARRAAPERAAPEVLVESLGPDQVKDPRRLTSLETAALATGSSEEIHRREHQLTTSSLSLLTDPVNGGLKTDLTTLLESGQSAASLMGEDAPYFTAADGAPAWDYIQDHYQKYRSIKGASSGNPTFQIGSREVLDRAFDAVTTDPVKERLLPVVAKLQVAFSVVTHYNHVGDRVNFYNQHGRPKGNQNYAAPHLVYDPVITLYNPYDVRLELDKLRVRIWDPPVVFGFRKNEAWLRPDFANGNYHGLGRFQIASEKNEDARKAFTLLLTDSGRRGTPGQSIVLEPGEVRVFSPWVEKNWTWGMETGGGDYSPRAFFDWRLEDDFGNRDNRTGNDFGIETIPGWDPRAGLQTDHLSYAGDRPRPTRYDFEVEHGMNAGWLAIKRDDEFSVVAKPGRTVNERRSPDFQVDLLAGVRENPGSDIVRSYVFNFEDVERELYASTSRRDREIERTFLVDDLLQEPSDNSPGGKSPFAILTMTAKTTSDPKDASMPWVHNHPVTEGTEQDSRYVGSALDTYDLRLEEMQDFNTFPGVEIEPGTNRGFFGASATTNRGVTQVPMFHVPLLPAVSLGDMVSSNLVASGALPRVTAPLGSSRAHPLLPSDSVRHPSPMRRSGSDLLDHSYLLNDALWDRYFFSTAGTFNCDLLPAQGRLEKLQNFLSGEDSLLNRRLVPLPGEGISATEQASELDGLDASELSRKIAGSMAIEGGFNINSDSVEAWRAMLSSLRDEAVRGWGSQNFSSDDETAFPRHGLPVSNNTVDTNSTDAHARARWASFRSLDDDQITALAEAIVDQIRARGDADEAPIMSVGEFVNRRIGGPTGLHTISGLLEEAIEQSGINQYSERSDDSKMITGSERLSDTALNGVACPEARQGPSALGAPPFLSQGDLLRPLASFITVRGDTFRIRGYGESRGADGEPVATAWCEAVVQRLPEYVDASNTPDEVSGLSPANSRFGRRFVVTSFRWLTNEEV